MIYLDSSSLLKLFWNEPESSAVIDAIASERAVVVSSLAELETMVQLKAAHVGGDYPLPQLRRLETVYERQGSSAQGVFALVLVLVLMSATITEIIGIHALFGAFLMGAIMPKGSRFVRALSEKLEDYTVVFLLPIFFAYTGLKTQIGLLNSPELWLITGLVRFERP